MIFSHDIFFALAKKVVNGKKIPTHFYASKIDDNSVSVFSLL